MCRATDMTYFPNVPQKKNLPDIPYPYKAQMKLS